MLVRADWVVYLFAGLVLWFFTGIFYFVYKLSNPSATIWNFIHDMIFRRDKL